MTDTVTSWGSGRPFARQDDHRALIASRLAKRRRADLRFQAAGIGAIVLAIVFLASILFDIVLKARPALTESTLRIAVPVGPDIADPKSPAAGDYEAAVRASVRSFFPTMTTRSQRKLVDSVVSSGGSDALRAAVIANPKLIGTTVPSEVLLNSESHLYLKGATAATTTVTGSGPLEIAVADDVVSLKLDAANLPKFVQATPKSEDGNRVLNSKSPSLLVSAGGGIIKIKSVSDGLAKGEAIIPPEAAGIAPAGAWSLITIETPEDARQIQDPEIGVLEVLKAKGIVAQRWNTAFLQNSDSREPEQAGILSSLAGTAFTMLVTLVLCLPFGVAAAIYLEEFAPKNWLSDLIEININNLAAVPSIVFGLLGLAVFLNAFGLPRSSPLVGGLVLALLVLPTIIIASRAALKAVPGSIRDAAIGIGATPQQAVFHHVLPAAVPGILTGTIIGMAHALGESAPLLMIGMIAFIADVPKSPVEAATVLPVQIFLWSVLPEAGFRSKTAAAILVLLLFLVVMNGVAIALRRRFERHW